MTGLLFSCLLPVAVGICTALPVLKTRHWSARGGIGLVAGFLAPQLLWIPIGYCIVDPKYAGKQNLTLQLPGVILVFDAQLVVSSLAASVLAALLVLATAQIARLANQRKASRQAGIGRQIRKNSAVSGRVFNRNRHALLMLLPTLLLIAVMVYLPASQTFSLSTSLARADRPNTAQVCLRNYGEMLVGSNGSSTVSLFSNGNILDLSQLPILATVLRTLGLAALIVLLAVVPALFVAHFAHRKFAGAGIYRALLVWGFLLSPIVAAVIMLTMFQADSGILDRIVTAMGLPPTHWLLSGPTAFLAVALTAAWIQFGADLIFLVAAMQGIPQNLLNAAELDGAGGWRKFRTVVLPNIAPILSYVIFIDIVASLFAVFPIIRVLTNGGPEGATTTLSFLLYQTGIQNGDLGRATAQSVLLMLIAIGIGLLQLRLTNRRKESAL